MSYPMKTCIDCSVTKDLSAFSKHNIGTRPECKTCEKARRDKRRAEDLFLATVNSMADGILKRTIHAIDSPKNRIYKERGIKSEIGSSRAVVRANLIKHFADDITRILRNGEKPSVDRIDNYGNYSVENIQIVTLSENLSRVDMTHKSVKVFAEIAGDVCEFKSISDAAKSIGVKRDTIYRHLNKGTRTKKGYAFYN